MKEQRLMAFWRHNHFPYCLHGEVMEFRPGGLVKIKEYGGALFRPLVILLYEEGGALADKLDELEHAYRGDLKELHTKYQLSAEALAPFLKEKA